MKNKNKLGVCLFCIALSACSSESDKSGENIRSQLKNNQTVLCDGAKSSENPSFGGGKGTKDEPYLMCTVDHFNAMGGSSSKNERYYKLTADLDFKDVEYTPKVVLFGSFDGNGHIIKNVTIKYGNGFATGGLFGQLTVDAYGNKDEVKNLFVDNILIIGDGIHDWGGAIAGSNLRGIISNVHVTGEIKIKLDRDETTGYKYAGGLVGKNLSLIENSSFHGTVVGTENVGGIAGVNEGTIRRCLAKGDIQGVKRVGGVVGLQNKTGVINDSVSTATISGLEETGNLVGKRDNQE